MAETTRRSEPERRPGVVWDEALVDAGDAWPEQLGLDTCGECDVEEPSGACRGPLGQAP